LTPGAKMGMLAIFTAQPREPHDVLYATSLDVSDHRGSNSQVVNFERVEIYPVFTAKIENPEKSST
jgi:hypothetical protein